MSVYFIKAGRYFKIGTSEDAERRCANLHQSGTRYTFPADVTWSVSERTLYKVVQGDEAHEFAIHQALSDFSVGLEWFLDEPPLRAFIDSLANRERASYPKVERIGGWCEDDYAAVQEGRAEREVARYLARRRAA